jgi:fimbrial isopeptide formation D2 family protein
MKFFPIAIIWFSLFFSSVSHSQTVAIPNGGFLNFLQANYPTCMSGNLMDTTCPAIVNAINLTVPSNYSINNLFGIQFFDNLVNLQVNYHTALTNIPYLPQNLIKLSAAYCSLTSITNLPSSLLHLEITSNNLTSLPPLPAGLKIYYRGVMPNLPLETSLPPTLEVYNVQQCNVINLPPLPSSLLNLSIGGNYGINIPILPSGLTTLGIDNLNLTALPVIPNSLTYLWAPFNLFTSLSSFPPSLQILYLNNNANLTSITNLPNTLQELYVPSCALNYIDHIPNSVYSAYLEGNNLSSIPNIPTMASVFSVHNNNLTSIPSLPPNINALSISDNSITCLPYLPQSISSIFMDNNALTCLPNILPAMSAAYQSYPLCAANDPINNPMGCLGATGIDGYTYQDQNANCTREGSDLPLINVPVRVNDNSGSQIASASSFSNGRYYFHLPNNPYHVIIDTLGKPYTVDCLHPGLDSSLILTSSNPLVQNVNFGLKCKPGFDVGVQTVGPLGIVFPGQNHVLNIVAGDISSFYNLSCASGISGSMTVTVNGPMTYQGVTAGSMTPTISGNVYTYSISDFGSINPLTDFRLDFTTDTTAQAGDSICVSVSMTPTLGDNDALNNSYFTCYNVVNSYDPNNKLVYPEHVVPDYSGYLNYTINFQNTGNAPAFNIRLEDTLSAFLDLQTFELTGYSHDMHYSLVNQKLTVYFPNIQLIDSTTSNADSKGYVSYKVKLHPGIQLGEDIENEAYIFFDFNSPILTNTAITEVDIDNLDIPETSYNHISIYPNPTNGKLKIISAEQVSGILVFDQQGRKMELDPLNAYSEVDFSAFDQGIYLLQIVIKDKITNRRIIKN